MNKNKIKILLYLIIFTIVLLIFTILNFIRFQYNAADEIQNNLTNDLIKNNMDNINYTYLYNDLKRIDNEIKIRNSKNNDYNEMINFYYYASEVYNNKINELTYVLNNLLDDEDYKSYINDLDEFNTNLQNESNDIENNYGNEQTINLYKYKNIYEKRHEKCYSILENYKGFFN